MNHKKSLQPLSLLSSPDDLADAPPRQGDAQPLQGAGLQPKFDISKVYANTEQASSGIKLAPDKPKHRFGFKKVRNLIFILLLISVGVTFFTKEEYRHITTIEPAALREPLQTSTSAKEFTHKHKDIEYSIQPLFEYELNGMVVSRLDYEKIPTTDPRADDTLFPTDLCMLWGDNLSSGVYRSSSTTFSQGGRWCHWKWEEGKGIVNEAVANNHLMFINPRVKDKLKDIQAGDQIKIIGKLVNVRTITPGVSPEKKVTRHSSIVRTDTGGTSCEDILVEDIIILRENRNISQIIFEGSLVVIGLVVSASIFTRLLRRHRKK